MNEEQEEKWIIPCNEWPMEVYNPDAIRRCEVDMVKEWVKEWLPMRKTINLERGSYWLKHIVEKEYRTYISNESAHEAMVELGYKFRSYTGCCKYNISLTKVKKEYAI
jgi:hypothetical protein